VGRKRGVSIGGGQDEREHTLAAASFCLKWMVSSPMSTWW